jgi:hypothetical protein
MSKIVPIPEKIQIDESFGQCTITLPWFKPMAWFLVVFCLFWNGFLLFWMLAPTPIFFKLFAIIHVAVGVGLTWYTISLFVNTTTVKIDHQTLQISSSPLWLPGYGLTTLQRSELKQIYIREHIATNKGNTRVSYQLYALNHQLQSKKLPISHEDAEQMFFIKHKVEHYFNIQPEEVTGAYSG